MPRLPLGSAAVGLFAVNGFHVDEIRRAAAPALAPPPERRRGRAGRGGKRQNDYDDEAGGP